MSECRGWLRLKSRKQGPTWILRFTRVRSLDGKRVETGRAIGLKKYFPTEASAWKEAERRGFTKEGVVTAKATFEQLAQNYSETELSHKAPTTRKLHRHVAKSFLLPRWGSKVAQEIGPLDIQKWLDALGGKKTALADPTRAKIRAVMARIYRHGQKYGLIPENCDPLRHVSCPSTTDREPIIVLPEQAFRLAMSLPLLERTLVLLAAGTGLRASELLGLHWGDIALDHSQIHVRRTWIAGQIGRGKTRKSRSTVPLVPSLAAFLKAWKRETPYSGEQDWVFPSVKLAGRKPRSGSQLVKDYLRPEAIKIGLLGNNDSRRFGIHNLRHSLASFLVGARVDPKTVQSLLRHQRVTTTLDYYAHAIDANRLAAQELMMKAMLNSSEAIQ